MDHGNLCLVSIKLRVYSFRILCLEYDDSLFLAKYLERVSKGKRLLKDRHNRTRVVVSGDAVDRQRIAFRTLMDQHQLAARLPLIFVPAKLHGQRDGLHRRLTRGQTIARGV